MTLVPGTIVARAGSLYLIALDPADPATWARTYDLPTGRLSALRPIAVWLKFMPYFVAEPVDLFPWEADAILEAARRPVTIEELEDRLARVVDPDQFREADARFRAEQGEVDLARRRLDAAGQVDAPRLLRTAAAFLDNLRAVFLRAAPELRREIVDCAFAEVVVDAGKVRTLLKGSVFNRLAAESEADLSFPRQGKPGFNQSTQRSPLVYLPACGSQASFGAACSAAVRCDLVGFGCSSTDR